MQVIITIKLHFFMVVAYFIQSDFLKTSLAKLTTLRWKRAKRQVFLRLIITAKHHIQPPSTRILIFFNPQHFWSVLKKIPPTQVHVFKPIHWTPLNYLRSIGSMSSSRRVLRSCDRIVFFGAPLALQSCRQSLSTVATCLRRFHVFVSSVFPFVDFATYLV